MVHLFSLRPFPTLQCVETTGWQLIFKGAICMNLFVLKLLKGCEEITVLMLRRLCKVAEVSTEGSMLNRSISHAPEPKHQRLPAAPSPLSPDRYLMAVSLEQLLCDMQPPTGLEYGFDMQPILTYCTFKMKKKKKSLLLVIVSVLTIKKQVIIS